MEQKQEMTPPGEKGQPRRHRIRNPWIRRPLKCLAWITVLILLIPVLIYIPPVQTFLKDVACKVVRSSTGMDIGIGSLRIRFPLDLSLHDVFVVEATGDTMVKAREAIADVKLLPLLKLDVKLNRLRLLDGYYRMVSPDSSMIMKIKAGLLDVDGGSSMDIRSSRIDLSKALLRDGDVSLFMDVWKKKSTPSDTTSTPFLIKARDLRLENIRFAMSMLPTIDTMQLQADGLTLRDGIIDLRTNKISVGMLAASGGSFTYVTPTAEYIASHPAPVDSTAPPSPPMIITGDSLSLDNFTALYATKGAKPLPGFDAAYLQLSGIGVGLRDFYNEATTLRLPIKRLKAMERCGLQITRGSGLFSLDSLGIALDGLDVQTANSTLSATATIPFALMQMQPDAKMTVKADGSIGKRDLDLFMPSLRAYTRLIPDAPIDLRINADGSISDLNIPELKIDIPRTLSLSASGNVTNPTDMKRMQGKLAIAGSLSNPDIAKPFLKGTGIDLPTFTIRGTAAADRMNYSADLDLLTSQGDLAAAGHFSLNAESYQADVKAANLNVAHFMPSLGIGRVSATVSAAGAGFNPSSPRTATDTHINISSIEYGRQTLRDITASVQLHAGEFSLQLDSPNPVADLMLQGSGSISGGRYIFDVDAKVDHIDLQALGLTPEMNSGNLALSVRGSADPAKWLYDVDLDINRLDWNMPDQYLHLPAGLTASLQASEDAVACQISSELTDLDFTAQSGLQALMQTASTLGTEVNRQIDAKSLDVEGLRAALPGFDLSFNASGSGLIRQFIQPLGVNIDTIYGQFHNRDLLGGNIALRGLDAGSIKLDTISFGLSERNNMLDYELLVNNAPGTLDEFAKVRLGGYIGGSRASLSVTQQNIQGETGYRLGLTAAYADSTISVHLTPLKATIAYKPWRLNIDNHIDYHLDNRIEANLKASGDNSSILLETLPAKTPGDTELHVNLDNIRVQDFLQMSLFAPPVKASIFSDMNIVYKGTAVTGGGNLEIRDLTYNKVRAGTFNLLFDAGLDFKGDTKAEASLLVNDAKALTVTGRIKTDSIGTSPVDLGLRLTRFPLSVANPFLGSDVASLRGALNGQMDMTGTFDAPLLNGSLSCDSVSVFIPMMGSALRFSDNPIEVSSNVIRFRDFAIRGANENPLVISGDVDARRFNDISFDIGVKGDNVMVMNNDRRAKSDLYGKLFINLDASARGPMKHFDVNANLSILGNTDLSYTLSMDQSNALQQQQSSGDVVRFVQFSDTTQVAKSDSIAQSMAMRIRANLNIIQGAEVTVNLSSNGTDKVQISPSGNLSFYQTFMGDMRLNGQLNINSGMARYSIPVIGEKKFTFLPGSYANWTGDLMNPMLNIKAVDQMKANVQQAGSNSRLINFDVTLAVTNTLSSPKVMFDLSTDDDLTVQNELQSMSADQRSNQAMNMLLYGVYTGPGVKANSNLSGNPLYSFLESQINSWAAKNIRGVDLSFGIDQYDKTTDGRSSTTTSYSYQVSKSLFDNRFKIVVGGNYSTDASADENFAENLISDIAFEYVLKQTNNLSMYLKLFRHTGFESVLEGEVTETGVGFVMKKRINNFRQLFPHRRRKTEAEATDSLNDHDKTVNK